MPLVVGLDFNTLAAANPTAPVANWLKPTPASPAQIILDGAFKVFGLSSGTPAAMWYYQDTLNAQKISSEITVGNVASRNGAGAILIEGANGNGYGLVTAGFGASVELVKYVAAVRDVTPLLSVTTALVTNTTKLKLEYESATDTLRLFKNGVQIGTNVVDSTYSPVYGGVAARDGRVKSVDIAQEGILVDSFNGASDIERGQQNVTYTTTGFSSVTSITTNTAGVTVSGISDTAGDGNCDISDYIEAGLYPTLPASVIYTFGDGTNTAEITKTLTVKSTDTSIVTVGMVAINDSWLGYLLEQAGRSIVDGGQIIWPTSSGVTFGADGSINNPSGTEVTVNIWYRDPANGRMYNYDLTVTSTGEIVSFASTSRIGIGIGIGI